MSQFLMDHNVRPGFNGVQDTDFGPTTTHNIRYSIADYKKMLRLFVLSSTSDMVLFGYKVVIDGIDQLDGDANTFQIPPLKQEVAVPFNFVNEGIITEFPACPFADGLADPREDADVTLTYSRITSITLDLFNPRTEQSGWDTATHVWLSFVVDFPDVSVQQSYVCDPSGDHGDGPLPSLPTDYLGIDYSPAVGVGVGATGSFSLGDGTTKAYFNDPGTGSRVVTLGINSTNF